MPTNKNLRRIENQYERLKYRAKNQKKLREIAPYYNCRDPRQFDTIMP
jgi:hypothetical protein